MRTLLEKKSVDGTNFARLCWTSVLKKKRLESLCSSPDRTLLWWPYCRGSDSWQGDLWGFLNLDPALTAFVLVTHRDLFLTTGIYTVGGFQWNQERSKHNASLSHSKHPPSISQRRKLRESEAGSCKWFPTCLLRRAQATVKLVH